MQQPNRYRSRSMKMDEMLNKQHNKKLRRRVFYLVLFVAIFAVALAVCFVVFFNIKTIKIEGSAGYSDEEILAALGIEEGTNLYSFDVDEVESNLVHALPYINGAKIERKLPSTVVVHINECLPSMYVNLQGDYYLLTDSMQILEHTNDITKLQGLMRVDMKPETVSRCIVGENLLFSDKRTGEVIQEAYATVVKLGMGKRVLSIDANNRFGIYLTIDQDYRVYMGDIGEFETKLAFAKGIVEKLSTLEGQTGSGTIDVSEINKGVFRPD